MNETVTDLIAEILTEKFEVPAEDVTPDRILEDLAVDSLALLEMSLILEKRLGVSIAEGVIHSRQTVGEAAEVVGSLAVAV
uniref:Acyl carrier protein n=1 Tax=Streptomyces sp. NBC_00049 TaxID=2903617 RepID=A0AAU2JP48_9ACTN